MNEQDNSRNNEPLPSDDSFLQRQLDKFVNDLQKTTPIRKTRKAKSYFAQTPPTPKRKPSTHEKKTILSEHQPPQPVDTLLPPEGEFKEWYSLPEKYQITFVRLIARDPHWLYACWEIDSKAAEQLRHKIGETLDRSTYTLRVYDVSLIDFNGTNANSHFDIDELFMGNKYIHVAHDNASYCVEIGVRTTDNQFHAFARSNVVSTHPAGQSRRSELIWKEVRNLDHQHTYTNGNVHKDKLKNCNLTKNDWHIHLSKLALSPQDISNFYEKGVPLKHILKGRVEEALGQKMAHLAQTIDFEDIVVTETITGPYRYSKTYRGGSEEITKDFLGASEGFYFKEIKTAKKKKFPFEIEMDLTVRGRTEPGAHVALNGVPLPLEEDGTFTLKFTLNDEMIPFTFKARSQNNDMGKNIDTSVLRTQTESQQT